MANKPKKLKIRGIRAAIAVLILLRLAVETSTSALRDSDTYLAAVEDNAQMDSDEINWGLEESERWDAADAVMIEVSNLYYQCGDTSASTTALADANDALKLLL